MTTVGQKAAVRREYDAEGLADGVARLRRAMRRAARLAAPDNPLSVAQLEVLSCVVDHPGARPGQVAGWLHLRANTVTTIVNALAARRLICRAERDRDRRAVSLHVSAAGYQAVHAWQATNSAVLHLGLQCLAPSQRRALVQAVPALEAMIQAIDHLADAAATPTSTDPT